MVPVKRRRSVALDPPPSSPPCTTERQCDLVAQMLCGIPNEMWNFILGNLEQEELVSATTVSKKFRSLALDPALWKALDLSALPEQRFKMDICMNLINRCTMLREFYIQGGGTTDPETEALAHYAVRKHRQMSQLEMHMEFKEAEVNDVNIPCSACALKNYVWFFRTPV